MKHDRAIVTSSNMCAHRDMSRVSRAGKVEHSEYNTIWPQKGVQGDLMKSCNQYVSLSEPCTSLHAPMGPLPAFVKAFTWSAV
jgi:hypothetical protein